MSVYQVIKIIVAIGIVIGGGDVLFGNRFRIGEKFKEGFSMCGRMMLSIAGIMSVAPLLAALLEPVLVPVFRSIGVDPAVVGIILGCDMGGYQLSLSLADSKRIVLMMGLATASMVGGTLTFSIPVANAMLQTEDLFYFSQGLLYGFFTIPIGSMLGGVLLGISVKEIVINNVPVILFTLLLIIGFKLFPGKILNATQMFGSIITKIGIIGIIVGSVSYLTGIELIPSFTPIMESMKVVCGMTITLIGMLPMLEIFMHILEKPLQKFGNKTGIDAASISGMIFTTASAVPTFAMMKDMSKRGIVLNSAWSVTCAAIFGSQLSFVLEEEPETVGVFIVSKIVAGIVALLIAFFATKSMKERKEL